MNDDFNFRSDPCEEFAFVYSPAAYDIHHHGWTALAEGLGICFAPQGRSPRTHLECDDDESHEHLNLRSRVVLSMRRDGFTYKQIGDLVGLTIQGVQQLIKRAHHVAAQSGCESCRSKV